MFSEPNKFITHIVCLIPYNFFGILQCSLLKLVPTDDFCVIYFPLPIKNNQLQN